MGKWRTARQGELLMIRLAEIPQGATLRKEEQEIVAAHSETGHHHVLQSQGPTPIQLFGSEDPLTSYVALEAPATLTHLRAWDTHIPVSLDPGVYEFRKPREFVNSRWREIMD